MGTNVLCLKISKLKMNSSSKLIELSIVIPALNEEKRIGKTLDELSKFLKSDMIMSSVNCEVIVVSADGTDRTHEVAIKHSKKFTNFVLLKPGKPVGKGRDVQYAMLRAKGNHAIFMDADLATPLHHLPVAYSKALEGSDIVIATRNLQKHHSSLPRRILSQAGNAAFRVLGGVWVEDSQCGFKLFSHQAIRICFKRQTIMRWGFDMELLAIAKTHGLAIERIRVNDWQHVPGGTFDSRQIIHNALQSLEDLLYIARNRLLGRYKG